jgi:hypothetical protein
MLIRCALTVLVTGSVVSPAPAPVRYRIEQRSENVIDLSAFGQPDQNQNSAFAWYLTVSYTDSAGGAVLHAVLDSLQVDLGTNPVAQGSIDSATGTVYHGFVDARRKVQSLTASKTSTYGAQFEAMLRSLHPVWKPGAKAGEAWTDTLDIELNTPSIKTKSRSVRNYTVGGTETWDGTQATKLAVAFSESTTGTLETPGGPADIEGKATGTGSWYIAPDGRYLGGKSASSGDGTVTIATAPSAIPVKSTTTTSVTVLK